MLDLSRQYRDEDGKFLTENLYSGNFLLTLFSCGKSNYSDIYKDFLIKNFRPCSLNDSNIIECTTKEDFIVSNDKVYIIFARGLKLERLNSLKLHLVENFFANWDTPEKVITKALINSKITISTLSAEDIVSNSFFENKAYSDGGALIPDDKIRADIQFIIWAGNSYSKYKGVFDDKMKRHISMRNANDLLTFIVYTGSDVEYQKNNYEESIKYVKDIEYIKITLTKEEDEQLSKINSTIINQDNQNIEGVKDQEGAPVGNFEDDPFSNI